MSKIYVDALAGFFRESVLIPKSFKWTDGMVYHIDRITGKKELQA